MRPRQHSPPPDPRWDRGPPSASASRGESRAECVGGTRFPTSLPSSGKSGPGSILCLTPGGRGCRAPLHPVPSGQAGRGRSPDSWGRAGLGSLSSPPAGRLRLPPPPPPRRSPHLFPTQLGAARARPGAGVAAARGQGAAAGPGWNKVCRPGPGSSRRGSGGQFANTK